jgi:hypothetical protein
MSQHATRVANMGKLGIGSFAGYCKAALGPSHSNCAAMMDIPTYLSPFEILAKHVSTAAKSHVLAVTICQCRH